MATSEAYWQLMVDIQKQLDEYAAKPAWLGFKDRRQHKINVLTAMKHKLHCDLHEKGYYNDNVSTVVLASGSGQDMVDMVGEETGAPAFVHRMLNSQDKDQRTVAAIKASNLRWDWGLGSKKTKTLGNRYAAVKERELPTCPQGTVSSLDRASSMPADSKPSDYNVGPMLETKQRGVGEAAQQGDLRVRLAEAEAQRARLGEKLNEAQHLLEQCEKGCQLHHLDPLESKLKKLEEKEKEVTNKPDDIQTQVAAIDMGREIRALKLQIEVLKPRIEATITPYRNKVENLEGRLKVVGAAARALGDLQAGGVNKSGVRPVGKKKQSGIRPLGRPRGRPRGRRRRGRPETGPAVTAKDKHPLLKSSPRALI